MALLDHLLHDTPQSWHLVVFSDLSHGKTDSPMQGLTVGVLYKFQHLWVCVRWGTIPALDLHT